MQRNLVLVDALVLHWYISLQILVVSELQWLKEPETFANTDAGWALLKRTDVNLGVVLGRRGMSTQKIFFEILVGHWFDFLAECD